jgi:L-threonylcarbamoyladenylate synthase
MKLKINRFNVDNDLTNSVEQATKLFFNGGVFIYPTDTIYAFGGNPFNQNVMRRISEIKRNDKWKRYIQLVGGIEILKKYVDINYEQHLDFLLKIWPNPVSVILKLNDNTKKIYKSSTMAFRIPNNTFCLKLLKKIQMPLISTSVNLHHQEPLTNYEEIIEQFGLEVDAIFYTEKKSFFVSSTVIDLSEGKPNLVREGKIKFEKILKSFEESYG